MIDSIKRFIISHTYETSALCAILFCGAFFRLYNIHHYMSFLGDEGRDALVVLRLVRTFDVPLIGPGTSVGSMYLGPLYYYMIAIPMALTNVHPVSAAILVALLAIITIFLIYYIGRIMFGPVAGLTASALYAVAYVPITMGRSSWNPYPMPFFALVAFIAMYKTITNKQPKWLVVVGIAVAFALQMHLMGLILLPFLGIFGLYGLFTAFKDGRLKSYIMYSSFAFLTFVLSFLPLIAFDLRHNYVNFNAFKAYFSNRETSVNLNPINTSGELWEIYSETYVGRFLAYDFPGVGMIISVLLPFFIIIYGVWAYRRRQVSLGFVMLASWLVVSIVGITLIKSHVYDHYLGFMSISGYLLLGLFIAWLWQLSKYTKFAAAGIFIALLGMYLYMTPLKYPPNKQLERTREVARFIIDQSGGKPYNFALISKNNYDDSYQFYLEYLGSPMTIINPQNFESTKTDQLFVVCEDPVCEPVNNERFEIAAFGWATIEKEIQVRDTRVFKLKKAVPPEAL